MCIRDSLAPVRGGRPPAGGVKLGRFFAAACVSGAAALPPALSSALVARFFGASSLGSGAFSGAAPPQPWRLRLGRDTDRSCVRASENTGASALVLGGCRGTLPPTKVPWSRGWRYRKPRMCRVSVAAAAPDSTWPSVGVGVSQQPPGEAASPPPPRASRGFGARWRHRKPRKCGASDTATPETTGP